MGSTQLLAIQISSLALRENARTNDEFYTLLLFESLPLNAQSPIYLIFPEIPRSL
jgi:hypothetical protein